MNPIYIEAVGCSAPGLDGWLDTAQVLRDEIPYIHQELSVRPSQILPTNERRRATEAVRLAFRAAEDALSRVDYAPANLASVFASSDGDTTVSHRISTALAEGQRSVSPTDFHNSVHNAAAGYWGIAARARRVSVSLSASHGTFVAGLLEAAALSQVEEVNCLLVAFDIRLPEILLAKWPVAISAAVALVLSPRASKQSIAKVEIEFSSTARETRLRESALERLRASNPAMRALPLLRQLAAGTPGEVVIAGTLTRHLQLNLSSP